jgi:hypothetical protein
MLLDESADRPSIEPAIALRPRRPHSGTLAAVQHPELKSRHVRGATHDATECVDLADDRAFRDAADSWIARHLPDALERTRYESDARAQTSGGNRCFSACVPGTNDDDVELFFQRS